MIPALHGLADPSRIIRDEIAHLQSISSAPVIVAFDGRSGSGKTSLALPIVEHLDAAYIPSDDFYAAEIGDDQWIGMTAVERVRDGINWRRLRAEALEPLVAGRPAEWHPFDFESGPLTDGTYLPSEQLRYVAPKSVVVLDGAYSTRPELADLLDFTVLVSAPEETRNVRLAKREGAAFLAKWHRVWHEAEMYYFSKVRPPSSFDLVVENG